MNQKSQKSMLHQAQLQAPFPTQYPAQAPLQSRSIPMPLVMKLHLLLLRVQWGKNKSKIAHQDHQLDLSNHKQLKKMAATHSKKVVAKKQQESLDS
jgi:hypothetical protein